VRAECGGVRGEARPPIGFGARRPRTSFSPMDARGSSSSTRWSHCSASQQPPAGAAPSTAAATGLRRGYRVRNTSCTAPQNRENSASPAPAISAMSRPPEKTPGADADASTTARTEGSPAAPRSAAASSPSTADDSALTGGALSTTASTPRDASSGARYTTPEPPGSASGGCAGAGAGAAPPPLPPASRPANATYAFSASAADMPPSSFHAAHFAPPTKSNIPGLGAALGPAVACLKSA
jgi:hypothetical protein